MPDASMLPISPEQTDLEPHALKTLNERQREFCKNYILTKGNAYKSAQLAGYAVEVSRTQTTRLLAMPQIQEGIAYYRELFSAQMNYTREKVLHDLGTMAAVDVTEFVDEDWQVVPKSHLTEEHRRALVGLEIVRKQETTTIKPKYARLEALREIADILDLKSHDKGKGEGLSLQITLGQSVSVDGQVQTQSIGHIQIATHQAPPDEKDEV